MMPFYKTYYLYKMASTQNLVPVFGMLAGNTLIIGGSLLSCVGLLYSIKYVSTRFTEVFESIPKFIENPKEVVQSSFNSFDPLNFITRMAMLAVLVLSGVASKRLGAYLSSETGINSISHTLGYGPLPGAVHRAI